MKLTVCLVGVLEPTRTGSTRFFAVWIGVGQGIESSSGEYTSKMRVALDRQNMVRVGAIPKTRVGANPSHKSRNQTKGKLLESGEGARYQRFFLLRIYG